MGHRALVAYERPDGSYNCHYSHWGASNLQLKHGLTPTSPFGGDALGPTVQDSFETLLRTEPGGLDDELVEAVPRLTTQVDPDPIILAASLEQIRGKYLDYLHHEAFYVVDADFDVTAYRTVWFGLEYDCQVVTHSPTIGHGAIRTVRWLDGESVDDAAVRQEVRRLKRLLGEQIDAGMFSPAEALDFLAARLRALTPASQCLAISRRDDLQSVDWAALDE